MTILDLSVELDAHDIALNKKQSIPATYNGDVLAVEAFEAKIKDLDVANGATLVLRVKKRPGPES